MAEVVHRGEHIKLSDKEIVRSVDVPPQRRCVMTIDPVELADRSGFALVRGARTF
jgi:hypothetical protein